MDNPRAYEGELAIERQLPGTMSLTASYIYTRGVHLPQYLDVNLAPTTATKTYDVVNAAGATQLQATVPFYANPSWCPARVPLRPSWQETVVNSVYNGLVLTLRKPMSHGIEVLANYTYSRATDDGQASYNGAVGPAGEVFLTGPGYLDPYNLKLEQGRSGIDVPSRFTASVVWAPNYSVNSRIERGFVDGWSLSGTVTATNGTPFTGFVQSSSSQCLIRV